MTLYVDASVLLTVYFGEPASRRCEGILIGDPGWVTARHTRVEVRRNLPRALTGRPLTAARLQFERDWDATTIVDLTDEVVEAAVDIAEVYGVRTLDALHLGAAQAVGGGGLAFATCDQRQASAARSLGWTVVGT